MYQRYVKRILDIIFSLLLIIICSPIYLVVGILVRVKLGSPVIFKQERPGYRGRIFMLYKFRTMTDEKDSSGNLLPDGERLTKFGKFLRSSSLDEIPEFFNILFGHMSFIGPRPLLERYINLYSARQRRRHEVLPGLTGWAQVNGRNAISWEEKFEYDLEYVENISFLMDLKIFFLTLVKVLARVGISAYTSATVEVFQGTKRQRGSFTSQRKRINILFSSVGKRVELIQTFLYAADNLGVGLQIYGSSSTETDPGLLYCHKVLKTSELDNPEYIREILSLCKKEKIDMVIPFQERELLLFSHYHQEFDKIGTKVLVSREEIVNLCSNKKWTRKFFGSCKVRYTEAVDNLEHYDSGYPCLVEVLDENDNIQQTMLAHSQDDVRYCTSKCSNYLLRPYVEGKVYVIDTFCDMDGNPVYITPRAMEEANNNEVSKFRVVHDQEMIEETKRILEAFKPCGPLTIKLTKQEKTGVNYYIRLEPRFDEAAPVTIRAGADTPRAVIDLLLGNPLSYRENAADNDVVFSRFEQSVCLNKDTGRLYEIQDLKELLHMDNGVDAYLFDLDDTLYSKKEYLRSGYHAVAELLPQVKNAFNKMCVAFEKGQLPVETVLHEEGIYTDELRDKCLNAIRDHKPAIRLYDGVEEVFRELHMQKKVIGIITDGDPKVQNGKIDSLGLRSLVDEILITDELAGNGDVKAFRRPNDLAYLIMKRRLDVPCRNTAWVGDDKNTDFIAPNKLGMHCYWLINEDSLDGN